MLSTYPKSDPSGFSESEASLFFVSTLRSLIAVRAEIVGVELSIVRKEYKRKDKARGVMCDCLGKRGKGEEKS